MTELHTERVRLREFRAGDPPAFAAINADPRVMRHFPRPLDRSESDAFLERIQRHFDEHGYGPWAAEELVSGELMGFVGLLVPSFEAHFTPAVEIGWRLAARFWGKGYATEAGQEVLRTSFEDLGLGTLVSFTASVNRPAQRVIERVGLTRDPDGDFAHPAIPTGHRLSQHYLYRIDRERWAAMRSRPGPGRAEQS